jgi:hypothetical protein
MAAPIMNSKIFVSCLLAGMVLALGACDGRGGKSANDQPVDTTLASSASVPPTMAETPPAAPEASASPEASATADGDAAAAAEAAAVSPPSEPAIERPAPMDRRTPPVSAASSASPATDAALDEEAPDGAGLIVKWQRHAAMCRSGVRDDPATQMHCQRAAGLGAKLQARGICRSGGSWRHC